MSTLQGHRISVLNKTPLVLADLKYLCQKGAVDAIICCNQELLDKALRALPDFKEPLNRRRLSLDDYYGSLISILGIPCLVLNPLEHLQTVAFGKFLFNRFITKLTKPDVWFPQTAFVWELGVPENFEKIYNHYLDEASLVAIDIETPHISGQAANDIDPDRRITCINFTAYFPSTHTTHGIVIPFDSMYNLTWIRHFLTIPQPKVLQGGQYDAVRLLRFNCPIHNYLFDTLNLFHSWYSELPKRLDFIAAFSIRATRYWKDDNKSGNLHDYYEYNARDGWATVNAFLSLISEVPEWCLTNYKEEFPNIFPCIHMELEGWKVDLPRFREVALEKDKENAELLLSIRHMLHAPDFNPNSPKQMKNLLTILGCGDLEGANKISILKASVRHPLNSVVLDKTTKWKSNSKIRGTYVDETKLYTLRRSGTVSSRLFYKLDPAGTDTGRLASSESAFWCGFQIQNIPARDKSVKSFLIADDGWELAEPDFSQSEARCVAYLSGDDALLKLVESGKDYHSWNVQAFFGFAYEEVWDSTIGKCRNQMMQDIRDLSKRTNHGANYNMTAGVMLDTMGPKNVAKAKVLLRLPIHFTLRDVCEFCLDKYAATYKKVKGLWYGTVVQRIELASKLISPLGWTRYFFGNPRKYKHHLNAAIAHEPQNLSVAIINRCLRRIWREIVYGGSLSGKVRLKAQIHDSIPFQYRKGQLQLVEAVKKLMVYPIEVVGADKVKRTMLIPVDMKFGKTKWSDLK